MKALRAQARHITSPGASTCGFLKWFSNVGDEGSLVETPKSHTVYVWKILSGRGKDVTIRYDVTLLIN